MALYNCKHAGDEYRISKFDSLGNVESSYLCTLSECQCPAGVRPTCRHRDMLPKFIQRGTVDTGWQLDWDRGGWVDMRTEDEVEPEAVITPKTFDELPHDHDEAQMALYQSAMLPLPEGVGESEAMLPAPASTEGWGEIEPEAIGQEVRINFAGTGYEQPLPAPTPVFNPTAGIPKTSFGSKDSPSYDNATWFSTVQPPDTTTPAKWRRF